MPNLLLLLCLLLLPGLAAAQTGPPPGGYPPRDVTVLPAAPLPPGGLVPYRQGKLWGYADTTGRLVVKPFLQYSYTSYVPQFERGFVGLLPEEFADYRPPGVPAEAPPYRAILLNARGELLRVGHDQAARLRPDGSLELVPRRLHYGEPELASGRALNQTTRLVLQVVPIGPAPEFWATPEGAHFALVDSLGLGRFTHCIHTVVDGPFTVPAHCGVRYRRQGPHDEFSLRALTDAQGRHLSPHRYVRVQPFQERRAVVLMPTQVRRDRDGEVSYSMRVGVVDARGRVVVRPRYAEISAFRRGRARVQAVNTHSGIVDSTGRVLVRVQRRYLSQPDELGQVRYFGQQPQRVRFLPLPGTPRRLSGQWFEALGPFRGGRAWAQQAGRQGLLDLEGRWVVPPRYELLLTPRWLRAESKYRPAGYEEDRRWELLTPDIGPDYLSHRAYYLRPDTALLLARRAGKYGLVARHSGREVVPCRYDSVLYNAYRGLLCAVREGQPYLLTTRGRELAAGEFRGVVFDFGQGPLYQLHRPADGTWCVVDSTGRARSAWLPGRGYPTPEDWAVVEWPGSPARAAVLAAATGQVLWEGALAAYGPLHAAWQQKTHEDYGYLTAAPTAQPTQPVLALAAAWQQWRLYDARLRPVAGPAYESVRALPGGWFSVNNPPPGADPQEVVRWELLDPRGRRTAPPPGGTWLLQGYGDYPEVPFGRGAMPTMQGYVTRGGRQLWEN